MQKSQVLTYLYNTIIVLVLAAGVTYVVLQFTHFGHIEYTDNARLRRTRACRVLSRRYVLRRTNMSRYGAYMTLTTLDSQLLSTFNSQLSTLSVSVMSVTLKQIYGQIIWMSLFMTSAFLLLDIPRVRTGIEKVPYWPVYGIKMLTRAELRSR